MFIPRIHFTKFERLFFKHWRIITAFLKGVFLHSLTQTRTKTVNCFLFMHLITHVTLWLMNYSSCVSRQSVDYVTIYKKKSITDTITQRGRGLKRFLPSLSVHTISGDNCNSMNLEKYLKLSSAQNPPYPKSSLQNTFPSQTLPNPLPLQSLLSFQYPSLQRPSSHPRQPALSIIDVKYLVLYCSTYWT